METEGQLTEESLNLQLKIAIDAKKEETKKEETKPTKETYNRPLTFIIKNCDFLIRSQTLVPRLRVPSPKKEGTFWFRPLLDTQPLFFITGNFNGSHKICIHGINVSS